MWGASVNEEAVVAMLALLDQNGAPGRVVTDLKEVSYEKVFEPIVRVETIALSGW